LKLKVHQGLHAIYIGFYRVIHSNFIIIFLYKVLKLLFQKSRLRLSRSKIFIESRSNHFPT